MVSDLRDKHDRGDRMKEVVFTEINLSQIVRWLKENVHRGAQITEATGRLYVVVKKDRLRPASKHLLSAFDYMKECNRETVTCHIESSLEYMIHMGRLEGNTNYLIRRFK